MLIFIILLFVFLGICVAVAKFSDGGQTYHLKQEYACRRPNGYLVAYIDCKAVFPPRSNTFDILGEVASELLHDCIDLDEDMILACVYARDYIEKGLRREISDRGGRIEHLNVKVSWHA
ncbi:MAG: hypothetical protein MJ155_02165 [Candidatus Saccharibacteria bacterium]|nr:hypothetical protein [Candidatus Saccharibacteria bacterium]